MKKTLSFYPYSPDECSYIGTIFGMLSQKYQIINYQLIKENCIPIDMIDCLYLNWIESRLDARDKELLELARKKDIRIIWVFHNRIPHDTVEIGSIHNVLFLARVSTIIILHSRRSIELLAEIDPSIDKNKTVFIPHPDFIGDYFRLNGNELQSKLKDDKTGIVYGFLGQMRKYKNIELIIRSFKRLALQNNNMNISLLIAGKGESAYELELKEYAGNEGDVIIDNRYISSMEMGSYLDVIDVLVLPYNTISSMNSGAMIMAFSYAKTVIIPEIAMTRDFDDKLMYVYDYDNEQDHLEKLMDAMSKALMDGKEELRRKGRLMKEYLINHNSKEIVRKELLEIV